MALGEMGNFGAYFFAPASLVAPLGTVTVVSNALIAPLCLGETFRRRDGKKLTFRLSFARMLHPRQHLTVSSVCEIVSSMLSCVNRACCLSFFFRI